MSAILGFEAQWNLWGACFCVDNEGGWDW
jgi:hypothetical protein